ncbi:RidA family protein [Cellulomonas sp. 179-A 4D5 NHS]|uniref:RidA family protein n=1 Tax=Cellulomonas sp. 179-A 4D5 NHS TaxID=3142378 RepID=UPI0039A12F89
MTWSAEARLTELGITLPGASAPQAAYTNCVQVGALLFVAGKGPGDPQAVGKLGRELTTVQGAGLARAVGLGVLAAVRGFLGSLDRVERVVRVQAFVNATEDFTEHHLAVDGLSELFVDVFGDSGIHTRSVLGAVSLRGGLPIIAECLFEVDEHRSA